MRFRLVLPRITGLTAALFVATACAGPPSSEVDSTETSEVHEIVVGGLDYTFEMEQTVAAGPAELRFENRGEVDHELVLIRLSPGATMADFAEAMAGEGDPRELTDGIGGILIAGPGEPALGSLNVDFEEGRTYMLVCNFTDTPESPTHLELGMIRTFTVGSAED